MGRMYQAPIIVGSHSAAVDYFELLAATGKPLLVHGFELGQLTEVGDSQEEIIELNLNRVTGAPTSGSGGSTPTFVTTSSINDAAPGATLETGNTTKLTGGTSATLMKIAFQVRIGYLFLPPEPMRIGCDPGTRIVLTEVAAPTPDAMTGPVGTIWIEELV